MPSIASAASRVTLAAFRVGNAVYALDVAHVREVVRWQNITPLPVAPRLIEGVIDLRGAVVPVVDLGRALGAAAVAAGPTARIAIVAESGLVMGLAVDAALAVMSVDPTELEDLPALATQAGYDATRAVVRRPNAAPVLLLSLEHILESVYRSALTQDREAAGALQVSRSPQGREAAAQRGEAERSVGPREDGQASEDHQVGERRPSGEEDAA